MSTTEFAKTLAVQDLLDAGLHFGHQTKRWNPKMKKYIFEARNGIYIIDLEKSLFLLKDAEQFVYDLVVRGRNVLFVGTKKQSQAAVKEAATKANQPYVVNRWLGGTLTNLQTIRKSVARMRALTKMEEDGTFEKMPKKELAKVKHELEKLRYNLSGLASMEQLPGALFVVDTNREAIAVAEAQRLNIPVVALVDTNSDPDPILHPIPGNDDAMKAIKLVVDVLGESVAKGHAEYAKVAAEESRRKAAEQAAADAKARAESVARAALAAAQAAAEAKTERKTRRAAAAADESSAPAAEGAASAGDTPAQPAGA